MWHYGKWEVGRVRIVRTSSTPENTTSLNRSTDHFSFLKNKLQKSKTQNSWWFQRYFRSFYECLFQMCLVSGLRIYRAHWWRAEFEWKSQITCEFTAVMTFCRCKMWQIVFVCFLSENKLFMSQLLLLLRPHAPVLVR